MKYDYFYIEGGQLNPSEKAKKELKIRSDWFFGINRLLTIASEDEYGLKDVSWVVTYISGKIKEKQIEFLLELITIIKKYDKEKKINWENTFIVVKQDGLWRKFLRTDIAKEVKGEQNKRIEFEIGRKLGFGRVRTMSEALRDEKELNDAFEIWLSER